MKRQRQYKLKFKPTPISRLLKRGKRPIKMVGYPHAYDWHRYWQLNYAAHMEEAEQARKRKAAAIQYGEGPFVSDYAAA